MGAMTAIQAHLDKIRSDAAECILLSSLATDGKREVFAKTAEHLNALATEIEKSIVTDTTDKGLRGGSVHAARPSDHEEAVPAANIAAADQQPAARPRRILPWFLVVVLWGIVAAFFWTNNPVKEYWSLSSTFQSKRETSPAPQDETKQAIATLLSGERAERKVLMERLDALAARLDGLVRALDDLKTSRGEIAGPSNKVGSEEQPLLRKPNPRLQKNPLVVRCALIRKKPCTIKCCKRALISGFAISLPECFDRFQQIVPARSQFSGKAGVFRARRIGDSGFLFSGGNICVKEIDDPGEVGNQVGYLGRLPYGVETPKMALVFHIVTSKWSSLAHLENLAACRGCIAIPAPRSRTGETDPGLRRRKPAGCLARSALQGPPHRRWLHGFGASSPRLVVAAVFCRVAQPSTPSPRQSWNRASR